MAGIFPPCECTEGMQKLKSNGIPDRHLKAWPLRWWPFLYARRFDGYDFLRCLCGGQRCFAHSSRREVIAKSYPIRTVTFSCNRLLGNKKSRHINAHRLGKRVDSPLCEGWFHINVTGFEIQSRNCLLRLTSADSSGRIRKRRYFLLAYRRRYPAFSRPFNPL